MKYKHIFFDLDDTLWDLKSNKSECLKEIFNRYNLSLYFNSFESFEKKFDQEKDRLWKLYRKKLISKETLSSQLFIFATDAMNLLPDKASQIHFEFITLLTEKTKTTPEAFTILNYLYTKKYKLHLISDGFFEVQIIKLKNSQLHGYFENIILGEQIGIFKPDKELFEYALKQANSTPTEAIMIGDNYETDILGAMNASIDQIFYNPDKIKYNGPKPTFEIENLLEIKNIL